MTSQLVSHKTYADVRRHIQPGDIIAFGGKSLFSRWAKLTTGSVVTHVAVVLKSQVIEAPHLHPVNKLIEATAYNGRKGVMINTLGERLTAYNGDIWWLPLAEHVRNNLHTSLDSFIDFLHEQEHKAYDIWQLFGSAVDALDNFPVLHRLTKNMPDFSSWFCSELVAQAFHEVGVLSNINASEVTPIDVCRFNIYAKEYVQLKGEACHIDGINTLLADGWGH